jgi:ABC-type Fe3+-hydroxamate transport system substrate-binding protein
MTMRVVSLVPSVTETLLAWGVEPIAVTRFCEQPGLRTVGGTKDPDVAAIVALAPDVVVVCDEENRIEDADALDLAGIPVHVLSIRAVADVAPSLRALAGRLGIDATVADVAALPAEPDAPRRTAFVPIWRRPWMTLNGDTYGSSLLADVGITNVYAPSDERYPDVTLEDAAALHPDLVLMPSEPYPFGDRHAAELAAVAPVVAVDGKDLFWWGVRTPDAVARIGAQLAARAE